MTTQVELSPAQSPLPAATAPRLRMPTQFAGGWEIGLLVLMLLLYAVGAWINPDFFGSTDALSALLRDASRYGVMAVGMTYVIVCKELDLSVGSIFGLVAVTFAIIYDPARLGLPVGWALFGAVVVGLLFGMVNAVLVAQLRVPAFIATLSMLFIGRGLVLGVTGGQTISFIGRGSRTAFYSVGETNFLGFNSQILVFFAAAIVGMIVLAKTSIGYQTYAVGGNEQAAQYAGVPTKWVRMRVYMISAVCATTAGLMYVAQDKGTTSQTGQGVELIVIASVIVGGGSVAGGRGRVLGACLGAAMVVLIDKVLREGVPMTRIIDVGGVKMAVRAYAQLPGGAVQACLGALLLAAVLVEPWAIRGGGAARIWAHLRGREAPPAPGLGDASIIGAQTRGGMADARATTAHGVWRLLARRDAVAVLLAMVLWLIGLWLRPDFWAGLDNTFSMLLAFTEIGLVATGLTFVIANGDIDLSVGSVLACAGGTAAYLMKEVSLPPLLAVVLALAVGMLCGVINGLLTARFRLPAFVATLGMFYAARGVGGWLVEGRQLQGFSPNFDLIGRSLYEVLDRIGMAPGPGLFAHVTQALSAQTLFLGILATIAGIVLARTVIGQKVYAVGGSERAARYAGINTANVRFWALVFSAFCAACAGVIYTAFMRSFNPSAGVLRELDGISSVIIGGGSIFGGYGTIIGSMAGAASITLIRSLLSLQILLPNGNSFVMPQHWINVVIGLILIGAVISDIWVRQEHIFSRMFASLRPARRPNPGDLT
jgi:ribose transport system permease protein